MIIQWVRAPWMGLMFAACGFTFALATSNSGNGVDARATATSPHLAATNPRKPLFYTNAFLTPQIRDLGDAAVGSVITRFINARGGIPPRRYTSDRGVTLQSGAPEFQGAIAFAEAVSGLPTAFQPSLTTAVVQLDGGLKGQIGGPFNSTTPNTPLDFDVTVTDSRNLTSPLQLTERFQITMVDSTAFKFAQSALHDGVAFAQYRDKIEMNAGHPKYTYTASNISVTDPTTGIATPYASLSDDLGLFLDKHNGRLVGRPLVAGTYSILVNCTDAAGSQALSRDKSSVGQVITFNVAASNRIHSALFALAVSIKGSVTTSGADSIKYSGLVDLEGTSLSKLNNSAVQLQIGDYLSPSVTIQHGKGSTPKGQSPAMSVNLSSSGALTITISGETFGKDGTIITAAQLVNNQKIEPVMLSIGDAFFANELLRFGVKARSDKFQMTYKFGPGNLGGGFLITQVTGKDDTNSGVDADSWRVQFVTLPHKDQVYDKIATATLGIGTDFTDTVNIVRGSTSIVSTDKRDPTQPGLLKLALNTKTGKGGFQTSALPKTSSQTNTATAIPEALNANGKQARFPMILTFNQNDATQKEVFGVEGARAIFPKGTTWTNKDLSK